jgi:hypothetical protein
VRREATTGILACFNVSTAMDTSLAGILSLSAGRRGEVEERERWRRGRGGGEGKVEGEDEKGRVRGNVRRRVKKRTGGRMEHR